MSVPDGYYGDEFCCVTYFSPLPLKRGPGIYMLVLGGGPNSFFSRTDSLVHPHPRSFTEPAGDHPYQESRTARRVGIIWFGF